MTTTQATPRRSAAQRLRRHSLTRIVVLPEHRVMFLPVPKSGCTSVLWQLAGLAGLSRQDFSHSRIHEVTRSMAIHDMDLWHPENQWRNHSLPDRRRIRQAPDWLRFSVARDPAPRLWSAWQSKLLLQEPRFVTRFGDASWFPRDRTSLDAVIEAFRDFVRALDVPPDEAPHDAHWGAQTELMADFDLNFVGRAEASSATLERLAAHLGPGTPLLVAPPRENANPIPYSPAVYDASTAEVLNRVYAADFTTFDYPPLDPTRIEEASAWRERAEAKLDLVDELVERHLRVGELLELLDRSRDRSNHHSEDAT